MIKVLLVLIIVYFMFSISSKSEKFTVEMDTIDNKYLKDIIKHHEMVIKICELRMIQTDNPDLKFLMQKIIWNLDMEISQIKIALNLMFDVKLMDTISIKDDAELKRTWMNYIKGLENNYKEVPIIYTYCQKHKKEKENDIIRNKGDIAMLNEIIEHLKIAKELSKNIMSKSLNDYVLDRANRVIFTHNKYIFLLSNMKNNKFNNKMVMI
jgi:uncharacterized protein (DUF305 family)